MTDPLWDFTVRDLGPLPPGKPCDICNCPESHPFLFGGITGRACTECRALLWEHDWLGLACRILDATISALDLDLVDD